MTSLEKYMAHLDDVFRVEPQFFTETSLIEGARDITCFAYANVPEAGMITGLTYGLSALPHPDWKLGRPEFCISVRSENIAWARVAAYMANHLRGKFACAYGSVVDFHAKIADDSDMDAFFIFAPSILEKPDFLQIDIGQEYPVNIAGLYPIYSSEIEVIAQIGLEKFFSHPGFDLYDVQRPPITL